MWYIVQGELNQIGLNDRILKGHYRLILLSEIRPNQEWHSNGPCTGKWLILNYLLAEKKPLLFYGVFVKTR